MFPNKIFWIFPALIFLFELAGCAPDNKILFDQPQATNPVEQGTNTQIAPTAEQVVYAFLTVYENDPDQMMAYLGTALRENLPPGGIAELIGFQGTLQGLVFSSGASAADPNLALVQADMIVDQQVIRRKFTLKRQDNTWVIIEIEAVE